MLRLFTLLPCAILLTVLALPARANTIWVGNTSTDGACDTNNLALATFQAATAGAPTTIKLSNGLTYSNVDIVLEANDIIVEGGYADCSGSPGNSATLDGMGGSSAPVIQITCSSTGCSTRQSFTLRNLVLKNGEAGGLDVSGNVAVYMDNVAAIQNNNVNGGGVSVEGSQNATVYIEGSSSISFNTASGSGGGIYCSGFPSGGNAFQVIMFDGQIYQNHAVGGGGVYLDGGCRMRDQSPSSSGGVNVNTATGDGGGVAVLGGAHFELTGNDTAAAAIESNHAAQGAGAYVDGSGSVFAAGDGKIDNNIASGNGGGLFVSDQATAVITRSSSPGACSRQHCSSISYNTAGSGGAGYVNINGTITVRGTHVIDNRASYGSAFTVTSYGGAAYYGNLNLSSSIVAGNYDALGALDTYQSDVLIDGVTFYGNSGPTSGPSAGYYDGSIRESGSQYTGDSGRGVQVSRSIFDDAAGAWASVSTSGRLDAHCIVVLNSSTSAPLPGDGLLQDPMLRNPASSDFMPADRSPALDLCTGTGVLFDTEDVHRYPRGNDVQQISNIHGAYDAGAIESDLIFFDDFEP